MKHMLVPGQPGMGLFTRLSEQLGKPVVIDLQSYFKEYHLFDNLETVKDQDLLFCVNEASKLDRFRDLLKCCLSKGRAVCVDRAHTFEYTGHITLYINCPIEDVDPGLRDRFSIVMPDDVPKFLTLLNE